MVLVCYFLRVGRDKLQLQRRAQIAPVWGTYLQVDSTPLGAAAAAAVLMYIYLSKIYV